MSTNFEDLIGRGTTASKPAAGIPGRLYYDTDLDKLQRDSGSAWQDVEQSASGVTVAARFSTAAGQSIPSSTVTIIDFGTELHDTHGAVTVGASWIFTVPAGLGGIYSVSANILFATTTAWATGESANLNLYLNGAANVILCRYEPLVTGVDHYAFLAGSTDIELADGDEIDIRVQQLSGGALALFNSGGFNHVSIHRVG